MDKRCLGGSVIEISEEVVSIARKSVIMEAKTISSAVVSECLRKDNYANWSVCVKSYLLANDLWQVIIEEIPTTENISPEWIKMNAMALHAIQISCGPDILSQIRDLEYAREAWNSLDKMYGTMLSFKLAIEQGQDDQIPGRDSVESGNLNRLTRQYFQDATILGSCSSSGKTLLHYAVMAGHKEIVRFLVPLMPPGTLERREGENNYTALALAAITSGNTKIAEYIVQGRSRDLVRIEDKNGFIPVVLASAKGHKHMTRYLFRNTTIQDLQNKNGYNGVYLLCNCIRSEILDIASRLLNLYADLPTYLEVDGSPRPLTALARVPSAFPSGQTVEFWDGLDRRYKPPIIHMYGRKSKKKTAQPVALWMEPISYWA